MKYYWDLFCLFIRSIVALISFAAVFIIAFLRIALMWVLFISVVFGIMYGFLVFGRFMAYLLKDLI